MIYNKIAAALIAPFGIGLTFEGEPGVIFDREAIEPTEKIYSYLIKLAKQRELIITDTPAGFCKFHTEVPTGSPVAVFKEKDPGIISIVPSFKGQGYYSHVSGQASTFFSNPDAVAGGVFTVVNSLLSGVLRPLTFSPEDTLVGDNKKATNAKIGRMFADSISYSVTIPSWRTPGGTIWEPNTTVKIQKEGAMIYSLYEFLIREVQFMKTGKQEMVTLTITIPGAFSGTIPGSLPWQE